MEHTVCTQCNHERCESCQLWSRQVQVQGGRGRGQSQDGMDGKESGESASEGEEEVRGGREEEEEGVSSR